MPLSHEEVLTLVLPLFLVQGRIYKKVKHAFLRPAIAGELIQTVVGGQIETENIACEGDMVVRADTSFKEEYIVRGEDFHKMYNASRPREIQRTREDAEELRRNGFQCYEPTRRVVAIIVDEELAARFPDGKFMGSWGHPVSVQVGDYLVSGKQDSTGQILEVLKIHPLAFFETYAIRP
ncbi:unnamed protein product [Symbiodinium sp. CCMP2592]|nr:unnamed protein product [Symbiodinium sp. CCMP2592]